jgi:selenide,water dikinase
MPEGKALVQTVDILSPIGRDPYMFGQIAAANALSDVYAMGGEPWCAMNVVFFPTGAQAEAEGLTLDVLSAILRGGADKLAEAGAVLAGGHTVEDPEPKYGLSVTGIIRPDACASNKGLCPGDRLVLTKALGVGILSTAVKARWEGWEEAEAEYCAWAARLNANAGRVIREMRLRAATDITGFGLIGHALEMAEASRVSVILEAEAVPLMGKVLEYAADGLVPAGTYANRRHCACHSVIAPSVHPLRELALFDAQTSGGMLLAVPEARLKECLDLLARYGEQGWVVGRVAAQRTDGVLVELQ